MLDCKDQSGSTELRADAVCVVIRVLCLLCVSLSLCANVCACVHACVRVSGE